MLYDHFCNSPFCHQCIDGTDLRICLRQHNGDLLAVGTADLWRNRHDVYPGDSEILRCRTDHRNSAVRCSRNLSTIHGGYRLDYFRHCRCHSNGLHKETNASDGKTSPSNHANMVQDYLKHCVAKDKLR